MNLSDDWGPFSLKGSKINAVFLGAMTVLAGMSLGSPGGADLGWIVGALGLEALFVAIAIYVHRTKSSPPQR